MRYEGADADHVRLERMEKQKIRRELSRCLEGRADHEACAHLIADLLEIFQAAKPARERLFFRMQFRVMRDVRALVSQQISVRPRFEELPVGFCGSLSEGEGDRAILVLCPDRSNQGNGPLVVEK